MRGFLVILFLVFFGDVYGQWHIIHQSGSPSGQIDLCFQNADTGFVIGVVSEPSGSYVLRTHNGGLNWDSLWYDEFRVRSIFMTSQDTGYISGYNNFASVMRTLDGGDSWQLVASNIVQASPPYYPIAFFNNDIGFIGLQTWWAKTTDAGETWTELPDGGEYASTDIDIDAHYYIGMQGIDVVWANDQDYIFHKDTLNYQGSHYFLKARDHRFISSAIGGYGESLGFPQFSFGIITIGDVLTQDWQINYFPNLVRVYGVSWPSENIMYAVHNLNYTEPPNQIKFFMKSIDGGQTWYRQETIEPYYYGTQQIFCPNDSVCYAIGGYGGRIYKTTNGGGPLLEEVTQVPLSVKEIKDDLNFSMAPNPTKGRFTLTSEKEQIKRVEVFDLQGKSVLTHFPKSFTARVDLSDYPSGVYLVQILAGDQILTGKIVVE